MDVLLSLSDFCSGYCLGLSDLISGRIRLSDEVSRRVPKVEFPQRLAEGIALQTDQSHNKHNSLCMSSAFHTQQAVFDRADILSSTRRARRGLFLCEIHLYHEFCESNLRQLTGEFV